MLKVGCENLPIDVQSCVLEFVGPEETKRVFTSSSAVSADATLWRRFLAQGTQLCFADFAPGSEQTWSRAFLQETGVHPMRVWEGLPELLQWQRELQPYPRVQESSVDVPNQSGRNLLLNDDSFWSSTGQADPDTAEHLVFHLPPAIVRSVTVHVFQASFQQGAPVYGAARVRVSVGYGDKRQQRFHFRSPEWDGRNTTAPQCFELAPGIVHGNCVRIDLRGRFATQPSDDLYYIVLRRVQIHGLFLSYLPHLPRMLPLCHALVYQALSCYDFSPMELPAQGAPTLAQRSRAICDALGSASRDAVEEMRHERESLLRVHGMVQRMQERHAGGCTEQELSETAAELVEAALCPGSESTTALQQLDDRPRKVYLRVLQQHRQLGQRESFDFVRLVVEEEWRRSLHDGRLTTSADLGEWCFQERHYVVAAHVFLELRFLERALDCMAGARDHSKLVTLLRLVPHNQLVTRTLRTSMDLHGSHQAAQLAVLLLVDWERHEMAAVVDSHQLAQLLGVQVVPDEVVRLPAYDKLPVSPSPALLSDHSFCALLRWSMAHAP